MHPRMTPEYARRRVEAALRSLASPADAQVMEQPEFVDVCFELVDTFQNACSIMAEYGDGAEQALLDRLGLQALRSHMLTLEREPWTVAPAALESDPSWARCRGMATQLLERWLKDRSRLE